MMPESKLIRNEYIFREMAISDEVKLTKKSMVRWLALSLGLISPKESRTLILDILEVLFTAHLKKKKLTTQDILDELKRINKADPNPKAVYYHLLRLKEAGILSRKNKEYFLGDENQKLSEFLRGFYLEKMQKAFANVDEITSRLESAV